MNENIVKKIQKLLEMAERGTENEKQVALIKAQKLMLDYHIEDAELHGYDTTNKKVVKKYSNTVNCYASWAMKLSMLITKNFRCHPTYITVQHSKGKVIHCVIYGFEEDVEICFEVFEKAHQYIKKGSKSLINWCYRCNKPIKGVKEDYCRGFLDGLEEGFHQQILGNQKYAVMVVVPKEVKEETSKLGSKKFAIRLVMQAHDLTAQQIGYQDGFRFVQDKQEVNLANAEEGAICNEQN